MKFLATVALAALLATPVAAQDPICNKTAAIAAVLVGKYGEIVIETVDAVAPGETAEVRWQIWVNPETGSWSFTGTLGGATCIFAAGSNYGGQIVSDFVYGEPT